MLSIRKVLFHELAHNVHSEHDERFFSLVREIGPEGMNIRVLGCSGMMPRCILTVVGCSDWGVTPALGADPTLHVVSAERPQGSCELKQR